MKSILALALLMLFAAYINCQTCGTGQLLCGASCYFPSQYVCLPGPRLCPIGHLACGAACYLPSQYHCVNGVLRQGPAPQATESIVTAPTISLPPANPCGTGNALCGTQCYVTANYFCTTGNHLCPCGARCFCPGDGACFNPTVYSCCSSTAFPTGHLVQGANKCTTATNKAVCTGVGCA